MKYINYLLQDYIKHNKILSLLSMRKLNAELKNSTIYLEIIKAFFS